MLARPHIAVKTARGSAFAAMTDSVFAPAYAAITSHLVALRKRAGLTQRELARRMGRELSFISRIEKAQRRVDLLEFVWFCRACGADPKTEVSALYEAIESHGGARPKRRTSGRKDMPQR
jgi:hypothetical protein